MSENPRFHDSPSGVISDAESSCHWLPKDSYQDLGKWQTWQETSQYVLIMRQVYAGGHSDWRLPTPEEALTLYDPDHVVQDWEGTDIHLPKAFVPRCARYVWTSETNDKGEALRIDLYDGRKEFIPADTRDQQATRLVREGAY